MNRFVSCIVFFIVFLVFVAKSSIVLDPDFGWHIRMGEYILTHGIPAIDPFSYTMPSFPFIDHEWLTNIGMYSLFTYTGQTILIVMCSLLATLALFIPLRFKLTYLSILPLTLSAITLLSFIGVRTQVITMFFVSLFVVLLNRDVWKKYLWALPLLMVLWVNLHGGFAVGVGMVLAYVVSTVVIRRKINIKDWSVLLTTVLATFVNPYGPRIWTEVFSQISDIHLRFSIAEWLPAFFFSNLAFWLFFAVSVFFVVRYFRTFPKEQLALYGVLLVMAISSIRHIPLWIMVALPLTTEAFAYFAHDAKRVTHGAKRLRMAFLFFCIICGIIGSVQIWFSFILAHDSSESVFYPKKAVMYLQAYPARGNLFSYYSWAGYVVWKLPDKKDFVDGRMPSWNNPNAPRTESKNAFSDYFLLTETRKSFRVGADKYHIDTVLLPTDLYQTFKKKLVKEGWKKVYSDKVATIYRRK